MALLSQATQVTRAVKNARRMREIAAAMARFGFGELLKKLGLSRYVPSDIGAPGEDSRALPVRLRLLLEELGPTFIKIGQILGGRPDLLPEDIIVELEKLQDRVAPLPFTDLKPILEEELGRPLGECFASLDTEPLASASIAQVHAARTLEGHDTVVKIRKPGVDKQITQDLEIVESLALLAEHYVPELRSLGPVKTVKELKRALQQELDFQMEALNTERYRTNFENDAFIAVPKVYRELSGKRLLTLERLHGVKLSQVDAVRALGLDSREILKQGMDRFLKSILEDGFFHADPHAGNILVLPDGRMGLLDFGSVGRLSQRSRDAMVNMFLAVLTEDYDGLVLEYLFLSPSTDAPRSSSVVHALQREVNDLVSPYFGLPLKDVPTSLILMRSMQVAMRYRISLPQDLVLVFRAIMTLENIGRTLDPEFDFISHASKFATRMLRTRYAPKRILKDTLFVGKDLARLLQNAPRQLGEILRQLENSQLKIRIENEGWEAQKNAQRQAGALVAMAVISTGLLLAAVTAAHDKALPAWAQIILWVSAFLVGANTVWRSTRT